MARINLSDIFLKLDETVKRLDSVSELISKQKNVEEIAPTHKMRRSEGMSVLKMDYTPTPITRSVKSSAQCMEDIYFQQGRIDRDTWEQLKGIEYDSYGAIDDDTLAMQEDSDDEFEQSSFASYHEFKKPTSVSVPNVETKVVDTATAVQNQQSQVASDNSDNSGVENVEPN